MRLTDEQIEKVVALRELLRSNPSEEQWEHYIDFTRCLAQLLDVLDNQSSPKKVKVILDKIWATFLKLWSKENQRIILETMDGDEALLDQVRGHPNGREILNRILERVKQQKGEATGVVASDVDISDILSEVNV